MNYYHHTVIVKATPFVEFTKRCDPCDTERMENEQAEIRRENLRRLIEREYGGNQARFAREVKPEDPSTSYFSDLLRGKKSFGEKAARKLESAAGLLPGQLDVRSSPLLLNESHRNNVTANLYALIGDLPKEDQQELLRHAHKLRHQRARRAKLSRQPPSKAPRPET